VILAIAPSPSVDVTYVVEELVEGGQARPLEVHRVAGGKAINAARAAHALGGDARVVAPVGGTSGAFIVEELARAGIPLCAVAAAEPTRTCVSVFARSSRSLTEIYEHAPPIVDAWPGMLAAVAAELADAAASPPLVLVSGGIPATGSHDPLAELARLVVDAGARWALDTHGEPLRRALALGDDRAPALVKVNRAEAAEVVGPAGATTDAAALARALRARTGGLAIVTDGTDGVVAADAAGARRAVLPGMRGDFPVGSGDTFLGALAAALDAGSALDDALRTAVAAATANALRPGAALFDPAEAARLAAAVRISAA